MEWISVKDKLPNQNELVLCYSSSEGVISDSLYSKIGSEIWFNGNKESYRNDITHWMPLPEPPKQ